MRSYILRRLLLMIPTLIGISLVCFILIQLLPGGPVEEMISRAQQAAAMTAAHSNLLIFAPSAYGSWLPPGRPLQAMLSLRAKQSPRARQHPHYIQFPNEAQARSAIGHLSAFLISDPLLEASHSLLRVEVVLCEERVVLRVVADRLLDQLDDLVVGEGVVNLKIAGDAELVDLIGFGFKQESIQKVYAEAFGEEDGTIRP